MGSPYDMNAPKRAVNMTLNEDLVRCAREYASNLSEQVEKLLAEYVVEERRKRMDEDERLDAAIRGWNAFDVQHGSFADEHTDL
ncbi:MAG: type II toxin-antitoxin system CcdA family antitoxin [Kofleriaceae bacterium]|nr:type II toxin-antitoxin system CcdA family antitoxin [Kofleriaceae bacterium]